MLTDPGRQGTYGKAEDLKGKHMRWPKIATTWHLPHSLQQLLQFFSSIVHVFKGQGLVVGILIAICITSGICPILFITGNLSGTGWTTMIKVLGVEWLILVISIVVLRFAGGGA